MIPTGKHTDWIWPFSYIPRSFNSWASDTPPKQLLGNAPDDAHLDIPPQGTWTLTWPFYIAIYRNSGWYFRFGIRYDYNDKYYTFPAFTLKHYQ